MSETKHTPGPWTLHIGLDYISVYGPKDRYIITDYHWPVNDKRAIADAHLIAAAPDLLAALEEIVAANMGQPSAVIVRLLDPARAVIAKAKGEA